MSVQRRDEVDTELRDLVARALEARDAGGDAALDRFLAQQPRASDVRRLVDDLRARGLLDGGARELALPERLGEFRLLEQIGSGGMGVVFLARQESLQRDVALKVLHPTHLFSPAARERFRREIDAVARLEHPGIVRVLCVGPDERELPWFAMERVVGGSLADVLRDLSGRDPLRLAGSDLRDAILRASGGADAVDAKRAATATARPTSDASDPFAARVFSGSYVRASLDLIQQVAEALAHAHARGVLHRDVKPSNVMVSADGRARLVDFGLAALEGATKLTRTSTNPGSLPYMSPEQVDGSVPLDARTDVYSLGVTLYELLTLHPAYESENGELTRRRILAGEIVAPRARRPGLPRDVETVCLTALHVEPSRRYATAAELAADLENARENRPIAARRSGAISRLALRVRRRPARALAAACLLLATAAAAFALQWHRADERADVQRSLRAILSASFQGEAPAAADVSALTAVLPAAEQERVVALLRGDPLSKERWRELQKLLPDTMRSEGSRPIGADAASSASEAAPDPALTDPAIPPAIAALSTGAPSLDAILRASLLIDHGRPTAALAALDEREAAATPNLPDIAAARIALRGRALALLGDADGFLRCREEAEQLAERRGR
jgi:serine/threonine protein kinase